MSVTEKGIRITVKEFIAGATFVFVCASMWTAQAIMNDSQDKEISALKSQKADTAYVVGEFEKLRIENSYEARLLKTLAAQVQAMNATLQKIELNQAKMEK